MRAGAAAVCITPDRPIWMAGFLARDRRSEGKYQDLFVKALALEDADGRRAVIVTTDLIGYLPALTDPIRQQVEARFGLRPAQVVLNASHTHCGPVVGPHLYPEWDPDYSAGLVAKAVDAIGGALADLEEAALWQARGACTLSVNRRRPLAEDPARVGLSLLPNPLGPADPDVPVLKVTRRDASVKAILFLYACHPTTMAGYRMGGDYAGFAQQFVQEEFAGATALFVQGCGADLKPRHVGADGRFKVGPEEVVRGFGRQLAQAVLTALAGPLAPVAGGIAARRSALALPVQDLPPRGELEALAAVEDLQGRRLRKVLQALDAGRDVPRSFPHTQQVITIGDALTFVALGGEMCVDYALRLKRELGARRTWVAGYCDAVACYIPSARMIPEGGYEVERAIGATDLPMPFSPAIEDLIAGQVRQLAGEDAYA